MTINVAFATFCARQFSNKFDCWQANCTLLEMEQCEVFTIYSDGFNFSYVNIWHERLDKCLFLIWWEKKREWDRLSNRWQPRHCQNSFWVSSAANEHFWHQMACQTSSLYLPAIIHRQMCVNVFEKEEKKKTRWNWICFHCIHRNAAVLFKHYGLFMNYFPHINK